LFRSLFSLAAALGLLFGLAVTARADDPALYKFGIGAFDVINKDERAVELRAEYQGEALWETLKPIGGLSITTDGGTYAFAGLALDLKLGDNFYITPSVAPGLFLDGGGKDLDSLLIFRSQLETGYRFDDESRLGVALSHRSNAGLGDNNPGAETATVTYSLPASRLRKLFD